MAVTKRQSISEIAAAPALVPEHIDRSILVVRGQKVLLDEQLADFYGIPTKALVQAVKRNSERFPEDFAFQRLPVCWRDGRAGVFVSPG